jgi:hypothetical protein
LSNVLCGHCDNRTFQATLFFPLSSKNYVKQGCQTVFFHTKNPNFYTFWKALVWKRLVYLMAIRCALWTFCIFCGLLVQFFVFCSLFVYFFAFWYVVPRWIWQPCCESATSAHSFAPISFLCVNNLSFYKSNLPQALRHSQTGWPDWPNFCPMDDCLLWAGILKITEVAGILATFFPHG